MDATELKDLQAWIGRSEVATDRITPRTAQAYLATLDLPLRDFTDGEAAPLGMHLCVAPPLAAASALGRDGHPARQGFMPPVPLPRRMWAAGEMRFSAPLLVGPDVTRRSTIVSLDFKQGRSGPLVFLEIDHAYEQAGALRVTERQTLVYREDPKPGEPAPPPPPAPTTGRIVQELVPDPVLLFRYSALTFNGHRIHYDQDYARTVEGYPDIVVHGPLIATLLLRAAAAPRDRAPTRFSFRALSPTFAGRPLAVVLDEAGAATTAWATSEGRAVMRAEADFA